MGTEISKVFVSVDDIPHTFGGFMQLLFLAAVYGYILCYSSNMIKDGSELLLLVPALAGVVGSIVLPVLGAVPDGAIVIFSGLGPDAQQQVSVGVGALAGSTIMLLTVPWVLSIVAGRVTMIDNVAQYKRPKTWSNDNNGKWAKLMPAGAFRGTGVFCGPSIRNSAIVMLVTLCPYLVIQVPAAIRRCALENDANDNTCESPPVAALVGAFLAAFLFVFYLVFQARMANADPVKESKIDELRREAVRKQLISIRGLFPDRFVDHQGDVPISADNKRFQNCIRPFFRQFDIDASGTIDRDEFTMLLTSLGEKPSKEHVTHLMSTVDTDGNGVISFEEFVACVVSMIDDPDYLSKVASSMPAGELQASRSGVNEATPLINGNENNTASNATCGDEDGSDEEEEEVEMPEDLAHLTPKEQQSRILRRSFLLMGVGVLVVLLFSDPMCDVLSALGNHTGIKPFYIAFVLAPLASNASELIAAYAYALKKTEKTITISFASLIGAACMNNTFCLSLFLFLIYAKNLKWVFSAETISIIVVEVLMFVFAIKRVHHWWYAIVVGALFPLSIVLVVALEAAGLD